MKVMLAGRAERSTQGCCAVCGRGLVAEEFCGTATSLCPWSWQVKRGLGGAEDMFSFDRTLSKDFNCDGF